MSSSAASGAAGPFASPRGACPRPRPGRGRLSKRQVLPRPWSPFSGVFFPAEQPKGQRGGTSSVPFDSRGDSLTPHRLAELGGTSATRRLCLQERWGEGASPGSLRCAGRSRWLPRCPSRPLRRPLLPLQPALHQQILGFGTGGTGPAPLQLRTASPAGLAVGRFEAPKLGPFRFCLAPAGRLCP